MSAPVPWPAGVPAKLQRSGYQRDPQDVVQRLRVDGGPPLRRLTDGAISQRVRGVLSLSEAEAALFEDWRQSDLDLGARRFTWAVPDTGAAVVARFSAQPDLSRFGVRWRYSVDIECEAPEPAPEALEALAALEDEGPGSWPEAVPFAPVRARFSEAPGDPVLRGGEGGPLAASLITRAEGAVQSVSLHVSTGQLAAFEAWWLTGAGLGARDILFPDIRGGAPRLGCFEETYSVRPAATALWALGFKIYLEAVS